MITLAEAAKLQKLIGERDRARRLVSDYRTWRHPDEAEAREYDKAARKADTELREYIASLTAKQPQAELT